MGRDGSWEMKDDHLRGRSPLQTAAGEAAGHVSDPRGSREKADNVYHVYHVYHVSSDLSADLRMMMGYTPKIHWFRWCITSLVGACRA